MPADVLEEAISIRHRLVPIGEQTYDADEEDLSEAISGFAAEHGVDDFALAVRAEKLIDLLAAGDGCDLFTIGMDGAVNVHRPLLEHAASAVTDGSNARLNWPE